MGLDKRINLIRDEKNIGYISLLCAFSYDDDSDKYIIYAKDNTYINDNNSIVYFGKVIDQDGVLCLVGISDSIELERVKSSISELFKYSLELENIKKDKIAFNRKLELPKDIFDNPYNNKKDADDNLQNDVIDDDNAGDNREYRTRLKSLADDIKNIIPVDKSIPNILYINYYNEMGMLLKSKLSTLKQLWLEYQLIYNERAVNQNKITVSNDDVRPIRSLDESFPEYKVKDITPDFDELLDSLSNRIKYIDEYLGELRELKEDNSDYDSTDNINSLDMERKEFEEYKRKEEERIARENEKLQEYYNKFQTIVDSFDKKIKNSNRY